MYFVLAFFVLLALFLVFILGKALGKRMMFEIMQDVIEKERKDAIAKSRHVLKGQFNEQLSPFGNDFPVKPSECRFLGSPLDFICFKGLDNQNVEEIVFIEVKSGKSQLNKTERSIREAIKEKKVSFITYRMDDSN